jgi:hypothetical protein
MRSMFERAGLQRIQDVTLENAARHMVAFVGTKPQSAQRLKEPARVVRLAATR